MNWIDSVEYDECRGQKNMNCPFSFCSCYHSHVFYLKKMYKKNWQTAGDTHRKNLLNRSKKYCHPGTKDLERAMMAKNLIQIKAESPRRLQSWRQMQNLKENRKKKTQQRTRNEEYRSRESNKSIKLSPRCVRVHRYSVPHHFSKTLSVLFWFFLFHAEWGHSQYCSDIKRKQAGPNPIPKVSSGDVHLTMCIPTLTITLLLSLYMIELTGGGGGDMWFIWAVNMSFSTHSNITSSTCLLRWPRSQPADTPSHSRWKPGNARAAPQNLTY